MHCWLPVVHDVTPVRQGDGLVLQGWPDLQATQAPDPLHTMSVPQGVPAGLLPLSTHVCAPVAQLVRPVRHTPGLVVQDCPAVHATQAPAPSHTMFVPQDVPAGLFTSSTQVVVPVLQLVLPVLQGVGFDEHT
jgi:hypothetical protein